MENGFCNIHPDGELGIYTPGILHQVNILARRWIERLISYDDGPSIKDVRQKLGFSRPLWMALKILFRCVNIFIFSDLSGPP